MGSLMAGWHSTEKDQKTLMYLRNKSLTREEIDAYWKSRKTTVEELSPTPGNENQENMHKAAATVSKNTQRSSSFPLGDRKDSLNSGGSKKEDMLSSTKTCWWTRSNLAFLNEPPVIATDGPHKYASQYTVANIGSSPQAATDN
ncbi:uncharacterized protein M6B38_158315 [Iris pallida]|uniref:Uncharacterized protein n=1 Tax=Iris pallida TaxID=29817 RepID=A0AAX6F204_IRIPA|nr:uncharacterized protein M6B38_158315 [Iris pallida]